jgi:hypothetical protein
LLECFPQCGRVPLKKIANPSAGVVVRQLIRKPLTFQLKVIVICKPAVALCFAGLFDGMDD